MKVMKCDRCEGYYDINSLDNSRKELLFERIILLADDITRTSIDLCPDCRKSFNLWLKGDITNASE